MKKGSIRGHIPCYTVGDRERWEGNWEPIEGLPWAILPAPSGKLQLVSTALAKLFARARSKVFGRIGIDATHDFFLQPDLSTVCSPLADSQCLSEPPCLVAEILDRKAATKEANANRRITASAVALNINNSILREL